MTTVSFQPQQPRADLNALTNVAPLPTVPLKGAEIPGTPTPSGRRISTMSSPRRVIFPVLYNASSASSPPKDDLTKAGALSSSMQKPGLPPLPRHEEDVVRSRLDPLLPLPALPKSLQISVQPNEARFVLTSASGASRKSSCSTDQQPPPQRPSTLPEAPPLRSQAPSERLRKSGAQPPLASSTPSLHWKKVGRTQSLQFPLRPYKPSTAKPLPSILRSKSVSTSPRKVLVGAEECREDQARVSSVESDMPSLASASSQSSSDDPASGGVTPTSPQRARPERVRSISFDARVWVCNFRRVRSEQETTWYTAKDLAAFKQNAINRITEYNQTELIPTGTGRMVVRRQRQVSCPSSRALFSHPALKMADDAEDDVVGAAVLPTYNKVFRNAVLENEIRHILLVDPQDLCLKLFAKTLKSVLPHVTVTACSSSEEAIRQIHQARHRFDVVIVEERLKIFHRQHRNGGATEKQQGTGGGYHAMTNNDHHASGSMLLRMIAGPDFATMSKSLFVGVSAHIGQDGARLKESGADFCWRKPPPQMDDALINDVLKALLIKRGRAGVAKELFDTISKS